MSKIKGITIWEQYVEHFVLGVAILAALAFTAMQFIGQPNAIERPMQGQVTPGQVDALLVKEAERINTVLSGPAPEIADPEPLLPEFERSLLASVNPQQRIDHELFAYVPPRIGELGGRPEVTYHVPVPPVAKQIVAVQYHDTIADEAVSEHGLQELFPTSPNDLTWVSAGGVYNLKDMLAEFQKGEVNGNPAPPPASWYLNQPPIVNIVAERQELINGEPSEIVRLDPIPGQFHVRDLLNGEVEASRRDEVIRAVRDESSQQLLLQPSFYITKRGSWSPPDPFLDPNADESDEEMRIRRLAYRLESAKRDRETIKKRIEQLGKGGGSGGGGIRPGGGSGGGLAPGGGAGAGGSGGFYAGRGGGGFNTGGGWNGDGNGWNGGGFPGTGGGLPGGGGGLSARGGGGGGGSATGGGGTVGGGGDGSGGGGTLGGGADPQALERLQQELAAKEAEIQRLEQELQQLIPTGGVIPTAPEGEVVFWVHDLDVEAGRTYRYRFIVEVYNPFCARKLNLLEEQHHLAERYVLASEPSEWSDPIYIDPPVQMFVVEAHPPQPRVAGLGSPLGSARVEIWRFYDGEWRSRGVAVEPGERINARSSGRAEQEAVVVDFLTDWYILDIIPDRDGGTSDSAAQVVIQNARTGEIQERNPGEDRAARDELRSKAGQFAGRF